jgi:hypothetical protein
MNTLLLDNTYWDLLTDANGNIAMARPPYARAQDVASAIKLFLGELWYDTSKGVPYFEEILAHAPPIGVFQAYMVQAAMSVPGVVSAQCTIESDDNRTITGAVTFTDIDGNTQTVAVGS